MPRSFLVKKTDKGKDRHSDKKVVVEKEPRAPTPVITETEHEYSPSHSPATDEGYSDSPHHEGPVSPHHEGPMSPHHEGPVSPHHEGPVSPHQYPSVYTAYEHTQSPGTLIVPRDPNTSDYETPVDYQEHPKEHQTDYYEHQKSQSEHPSSDSRAKSPTDAYNAPRTPIDCSQPHKTPTQRLQTPEQRPEALHQRLASLEHPRDLYAQNLPHPQYPAIRSDSPHAFKPRDAFYAKYMKSEKDNENHENNVKYEGYERRYEDKEYDRERYNREERYNQERYERRGTETERCDRKEQDRDRSEERYNDKERYEGYKERYKGYERARSRSPLDLTVRSSEPLASAVAPYTPSVPNLAARLSSGYLRDALATSFYRAMNHDIVPNDTSHHSYPPSYMSSPSSVGRMTPNMTSGVTGYVSSVTSPSRASLSSLSPTSPQKAQMSPMCTSSAPSPSPSPALSMQSDSDESMYSASGRKIERKGSTFQDGVTIGYTYDAFFVSDGRSRRKNALGIPEKSRPRYTCNECGKNYATSSNLSRHKQTHRSPDSKLAKTCPHCNKVYVSMPALSMHILTHELKHKCHVCDKSFSRPWLLQGHLRSHTGSKPYGCAHCGKAFADRSNLRAHMQTHSSFKHYECKRCNKSFALKSYLNKHYESACFKES